MHGCKKKTPTYTCAKKQHTHLRGIIDCNSIKWTTNRNRTINV